jgi:hypothetical protein
MASPVAWTSFMEASNKIEIFYQKIVVFFSCKILQFLIIKNHLDPELDPDPQLSKLLDLDPH